METSLHQQLKEHFRLPNAEVEVKVGRFRIDVVNDGTLVEIQQSGLSAIRDKVNRLLDDGHQVEVVKPLIARKRLIRLASENGKVVHRRWSPKRATQLSVFDELLYFTRVFPHPNLKLIVPLVEIDELRFPGHGRRRRWGRKDFEVKDRMLVNMLGMQSYETAQDLHNLLPADLASPFDTRQLADALQIGRFDAQRIGYVLRKTGSALQVGKRGNSVLYELASPVESAATQTVVTGKTVGKTRTKAAQTKRKKTTIRTASQKTTCKKTSPKKTNRRSQRAA